MSRADALIPALPLSRLPPLSRGLVVLALALARWDDRLRSRRALQQLDDKLLKDIGLDRSEAQAECAKAFWQA